MKSILVTGGAGFIGANFVNWFINHHHDYYLVNLDKMTYAANAENLRDIENHPRHRFVKGDICDKELVEYLFDKFDVRGVIHFAAESHVDNSIIQPDEFMQTNIIGTFTLLEAARKKWMRGPSEPKEEYKDCRFLHVSTGEVYGSLGDTGLFTETTPYAPNSPYSASKASSDMIVRSYFHTYGMNLVTTNCSNNYGPLQHSEKFIPTIIRKAIAEEPIPIYGDGKNVRDWLYVLDHCRGINLAFHLGGNGENYNIGGNNERDNMTVVNSICKILDRDIPRQNGKSYAELITFVQDRPGHDRRYAIDATKIENELGWSAAESFESGIRKTVRWYLQQSKLAA